MQISEKTVGKSITPVGDVPLSRQCLRQFAVGCEQGEVIRVIVHGVELWAWALFNTADPAHPVQLRILADDDVPMDVESAERPRELLERRVTETRLVGL